MERGAVLVSEGPVQGIHRATEPRSQPRELGAGSPSRSGAEAPGRVGRGLLGARGKPGKVCLFVSEVVTSMQMRGFMASAGERLTLVAPVLIWNFLN